MLAAITCPQISVAQGFTGAEFLEWSEESQSAYIQNAVTIASLISSRLDASHANCVSVWYFGESGIETHRKSDVIQSITEYLEYRPDAVLLAMIEKACGAYGELR